MIIRGFLIDPRKGGKKCGGSLILPSAEIRKGEEHWGTPFQGQPKERKKRVNSERSWGGRPPLIGEKVRFHRKRTTYERENNHHARRTVVFGMADFRLFKGGGEGWEIDKRVMTKKR